MTRLFKPLVFVAASGRAFAYLKDTPLWNGDVCYSPDSESFYALACLGFGGSAERHILSFSDPHHGTTGTLDKSGTTITYNDEKYFLREGVELNSSKVIPLPAVRQTEYLCVANGSIIYVSGDKYAFSYGSFKLYVGDGKTMRKIPITDVVRFRDGGTTRIYTSEGGFLFPVSGAPKWGKMSLTHLDPSDYDIVEEDGRVTILQK